MTTDSVPKQASYADEGWSIGGMAKGAGMLAPGLATMLVVITTDAVVDPELLHDQLADACERSFDRIDSDGCMSTNDTVILMSSGESRVRPTAADFQAALTETCQDLAQQLVADAEGAAHTIAIDGAACGVGARRGRGRPGDRPRATCSSAPSSAQDPNWGRVLAAIGTTAADFEPDRIDVAFNGVQVCRDGGIGEPRELVDLSRREVHVEVNLRNGQPRQPSGPTTSPTTTSGRTRSTRHELPRSCSQDTTKPGSCPWSRRRRSSPRRCPGWRPTPARSW